MSYKQLSRLDEEKCAKIKEYLNALGPNIRNAITLSKMSEKTGIDIKELGTYVDILVENKVLIPKFGLVCPDCGMIYEYFENLSDIEYEEKYFCHSCEKNRKIATEDVVVVFSFRNPDDFFGIGQNNRDIKEIVTAPEDISHSDRLPDMTELCRCINNITETWLKIHNEDRKQIENEKKKLKASGKIKTLIKLAYSVAVLLIFLKVSTMEGIENMGVRMDIVMFIVSFIGKDTLDYALEKMF